MTSSKLTSRRAAPLLLFGMLVTLILPSPERVSAGPQNPASEILVMRKATLGQWRCTENCAHLSLLDPDTKQVRTIYSTLMILSARWSPDYSRVAYEGTQLPYEDLSISVLDADGSNVFELAMWGYGEIDFSWSPDSSQLAYVHLEQDRNDTSRGEIYRRTAKPGSDPKDVAAGRDCGCGGPVWSPDGTLIALNKHNRILIKRPSGKLVREIRFDGMSLQTPFWFPDGERIAFLGYDKEAGKVETWTVETHGRSLQQLTDRPQLSESNFTFSPDGKRIAFTRKECPWDCAYSVWVMDSDGSNIEKLTKRHGYSLYPRWSPDGTEIAFSRMRPEDPYDKDLYVMNADGSNKRLLLSTPQDDYAVGWRSVE